MTASGVVLAGGASRRMGTEKARLVIEGQTLLARTVAVLVSIVDEVLIVGLSGPPAWAPGASYIPDELTNTGPLGGLLSGLRHASGSHAVVVACDLPFLQADVLGYLLRLAPGHDAVVPCIERRNQSLHAVYSTEICSEIERQITQGELKVDRLLAHLDVRWVDENELVSAGLDCRSFVNINTPAEWDAALRFAHPYCQGGPYTQV